MKNRAQLLDDVFNIARAGHVDAVLALTLTEYLADETEYLPWRSALNALRFVDDMLERTSAYGLFKVNTKPRVAVLSDLVRHHNFVILVERIVSEYTLGYIDFMLHW